MGLGHSSRCLLLRRKMAEADSSEVGGGGGGGRDLVVSCVPASGDILDLVLID